MRQKAIRATNFIPDGGCLPAAVDGVDIVDIVDGVDDACRMRSRFISPGVLGVLGGSMKGTNRQDAKSAKVGFRGAVSVAV